MSDRKRQRISRYNSKELKSPANFPVLHMADQHVAESSSNTDSSFNLTYLPNEVILHIYKYLTPAELYVMTIVGNEKLSDLTYSIEYADVSSCRKPDPQIISSYFSRNRVKIIKIINFNGISYLKPQVLTQLASRCKHLMKLSIIGCGVNNRDLVKILKNCDHLKELTWDIVEEIFEALGEFANIKTVNLFVMNDRCAFVFYFLSSFPHIETVRIFRDPSAIVNMPFIGVWLKMYFVATNKDTGRNPFIKDQCKFLSLNIATCFLRNYDGMFTVEKKATSDSQDLTERKFDHSTFVFPPCAQIKSDYEDVSMLSTVSSNDFSCVSIILTQEIVNLSEKLVESVTHAAGSKLKQLIFEMEGVKNPRTISDEESFATCDVLEKIANTSIYITDLNLITVHFNKYSPFKAIRKLRFLKTLIIPSCTFLDSCNVGTKAKLVDEEVLDSCNLGTKAKLVDEEKVHFKCVVEKCTLVTTFAITFCPLFQQLEDSDLIPIKGWLNLKSLRLYSITLNSCHFLKKVSESCQKLESLALIELALENKCIYTPNVIHAVQNAKNLRFIQINEQGFNPMYERFWKVISEASNLEGICIATRSNTYVERQVVVKAIAKLKYLHLFHFHSPRVSERLLWDIRKSMYGNGVVNFHIQERCISIPPDFPIEHFYYHKQPYFCCRHLHLIDFDKVL